MFANRSHLGCRLRDAHSHVVVAFAMMAIMTIGATIASADCGCEQKSAHDAFGIAIHL